MAGLSGAAMISRARELMEAPLERELVGLNVDTGLCYGFNETAAAIWQHVAAPIALDTLLARLANDFDVTPAQCRDDVERLVGEMAEADLVTVAEPA